ncbi:hypothetical protein SKAU_G00144520 [Synaphobranchus kaupii]|uniref:Uncharacterized protein n=1 Tax=Synaphobranchus kaupii TaxID=118154 RepID=A0A9Q1FSU1_SYNKA|nr:hypothetical protein SKAU_G00144520 [Synaphobranchus kaupii]
MQELMKSFPRIHQLAERSHVKAQQKALYRPLQRERHLHSPLLEVRRIIPHRSCPRDVNSYENCNASHAVVLHRQLDALGIL